MSDDEEKKDSSELTYVEARPFLVDMPDDEEAQRRTVSPRPTTKPSSSPSLSRRFWLAAAVNTISTVSIVRRPHHPQPSENHTNQEVSQVFVNKRIFQNPSLRHCQVSFAAFHFLTTYIFLHAVSRPSTPIQLFTPKRVNPLRILPLAIAMIANVVLLNASLANSSIQFYQIVRVLLTPLVALLNLLLYGQTIPLRAAAMLVPVCVGVGVVSYFDTLSASLDEENATSSLGVLFAFTALGASAIYTVWIGMYHRKLECSSMQLLMNQAPVSVAVMVYVVPFTDDVTVFRTTGWGSWGLILIVSSNILPYVFDSRVRKSLTIICLCDRAAA